LGHPRKFQRVSRLGSVTARHTSSGRQPNFEALNRRRHLYSAGQPSRWALAHILVALNCLCDLVSLFIAALWNRAGDYIFALWFLSFFLSFFLSSLNLSGRRLDVYHTSTHDVALVQI